MRKFLTIALAAFTPLALHADGGITIGQIERDGLRVTAFAAPVPIRAGPLDITLLSQEIPSNQPVSDAAVFLSLRKLSAPAPNPVRLPAWCSTISPGTQIPATSAHSKNKLLLGAFLPVAEPGRWELQVFLERGQIRFSAAIPFDALPAREPLSTWWPLLALVPAAILLYLWRAVLIRARRG